MNPGAAAKGPSAGYAQAMVDQRPVYDNAVRKKRKKKKRK